MTDTIQQSAFPGSTSSNVVSQAVGTGGSGERTQLVEDFDTFLDLLVTQIQNQDPTNPVETEQFTNQLVQFSELEQQLQSNDTLETILNTIQSQNAANVVGYIGSSVTADGATTTLNNGRAVYNLDATADVPSAQIQIRNQFGTVVFETSQPLQRGQNEFVFDGEGPNGQTFNDGDAFTITVTGEDRDGNFVNISTEVEGIVDGVDFSGGVPSLTIGSVNVPLTAVNSVNQATDS